MHAFQEEIIGNNTKYVGKGGDELGADLIRL